MNGGLIPIGKMAEINHVSISTLRLYDKLGLLKPRYVDPDSGYRYYDIHQNARLDMIAYMKELGMSLSEIGDVLQKEDVTLIEEILAQKNEQIHDQIRELRVRHDAVERAIMCVEDNPAYVSVGYGALPARDGTAPTGAPQKPQKVSPGCIGPPQLLQRIIL